ncbi:electron transfer flavoprotein subunit beta/FixA family protein [Planosporangium flavigriseum]|uniref:Electron transfer flavoprotein subunit beta n=1 Tax=Planosporangium flavigriseum TaxID=373681 RepID=A0A8J3M1N9_9ACTN|nr:electron transfer flavoprotein subunit beta/FixA family protein [Planosporangium flavigriseum]NJC66057.1 electron transfer flavoprotein subunit beta/FixA family protein [Planosporangium flavigriseum]GIG75090.1 electron transfer flavoprotein subunit beta [Planosporangium flavigriseum]
MKIVVLVKHVPEASGNRVFSESDHTLDRTVSGLLSELDEYAVEQALRVAEAGGGEVVALTVGPGAATEAVTKALQMGAHRGVHVVDDAVHGSDAPATSRILAAAIARIGEVGLVVTGIASTDAGMSVVPAMVAERLGLPLLGSTVEFSLADAGAITARRDIDAATETVAAQLPAIVAVTDRSGEPRYPNFKNITAAKKKPIDTWNLADLGIAAESVGLVAALSSVVAVTQRPPRTKGEIVIDNGDAAEQLVQFLVGNRFV